MAPPQSLNLAAAIVDQINNDLTDFYIATPGWSGIPGFDATSSNLSSDPHYHYDLAATSNLVFSPIVLATGGPTLTTSPFVATRGIDYSWNIPELVGSPYMLEGYQPTLTYAITPGGTIPASVVIGGHPERAFWNVQFAETAAAPAWVTTDYGADALVGKLTAYTLIKTSTWTAGNFASYAVATQLQDAAGDVYGVASSPVNGDMVVVPGFFANDNPVANYVFTTTGVSEASVPGASVSWSGKVLANLDVAAVLANIYAGTPGNDSLRGTVGNDTISGGAGNDMDGATSVITSGSTPNLLLTEAQVGKAIQVVALYVDGHGTAELVASALTAPVANVNDAPTGKVTVSGQLILGQSLNASNTLADADGLGTIAYQWQSSVNGTTWSNITGAVGGTYTLAATDVGRRVRALASYVDGHGTTENVASSATLAIISADHLPTGTVTITGTVTQNQTLVARSTVADLDGLGAFSYQWQASGDGSTWNNIAGATTAFLKLAEAQVNQQVRVVASYVDGHGTVESVISAATTPVVNVNDAPTGSVTISGTVTQNQTLTAVSTLADVDGLGTLNYQWQSYTGGVWTSIASATDSTFTLTEAQVGKAMRVVASYVDGHGTAESVASRMTNPVVNVNDATTGAITLTGTPTQNEVLGFISTVADLDGLGAFTYQWQSSLDGTSWTNIGGATGATFKLTEAQVNRQVRLVTSYVDGHYTRETVISAPTTPVVNVNDAPTGAITIAGTVTQNQTLVARSTVADLDGLGAFSYQWQASGDGSIWNNIAGATTAALKLAEAQVNQQVRVIANYVDGHGTAESVISAATTPVVNVNDAPTGSVTISGTVTQNQTLTAVSTLADADGLGTPSYQWQSYAAGVWTSIASATDSTFTLTEAQVGKAMRVVASYVDGHGTAESVASRMTNPVINVNDAPSGAITLTGTPTQNEVLGFTSTVADLDGLGAFTYQWQSSLDGTSWTNIGGATAATFKLTEAQVNRQVRLVTSYVDGHYTRETVISAPTTPVFNVNDAPTGAITIAGTATQNQTLVARSTLADADGLGGLSYQWQSSGDGSTWSAISGATNYYLRLAEAQVNQQVRVVASYTDGHGSAESVASAATTAVVNVNDAPTGSVTISGTVTQNQTLTASNTLADLDGLGTIGYQWQVYVASTWVNIAGASDGSFTLTEAQVGKAMRVVASYVDGHGTTESVASRMTNPVINVNDAPTGTITVTGTPIQNEVLGYTSTVTDPDGLGAFSYQWQASLDGSTWANISGATAGTFRLTEAQVNRQIRLLAAFTDGHYTREVVTSTATATVANVNDAPNGAVTITGTTAQNQLLVARPGTIADADGLGTFSYQWQTSADGAAWATIDGANNYFIRLSDAQLNRQVRVAVSYTDGHGTPESVVSAATSRIVPPSLATATLADASLAHGSPLFNGSDTFQFQRGWGQETLATNETAAWQQDSLKLAGITSEQLWFRQVGNDLEMDVIGTSDSVTVSGWYKGDRSHVQSIVASDGKVLADTAVAQLVQAMAALTPPPIGQITLGGPTRDALMPVITTTWH